MTDLLFWVSFFLIFYTYAGYPFFLWLQCRLRSIGVRRGHLKPSISVIVAVFNEEAKIGSRLENLLLQDYPKDGLEIIVVSDGSTDRTCDIVRSFDGNGVKLLDLAGRQGKAVALNAGVSEASGEIVVFTDARQRFEQDAVARLAANFSDPEVGCVSGELVLVRDNASLIQVEMGAYWTYEKWLRKMESATGSVVGATGAIYAIRRALYRPLPPSTILDDVLTPLMIVAQGYRSVFDGSAVAYDVFSKDTAQEWRRKVRTLAGNWQLLSLRPGLLAPWRNLVWWRFVSHKFFRLIAPLAMVMFLIGSLTQRGILFPLAVGGQFLLYASALAGYSIPKARCLRIVRLGYFFCLMNLAAVAGFWSWITGKSHCVWKNAH